jgi:hypothetical protein
VPEADPVTDPPCDVDPLSVGGGLSVGPVWPLVVDDVLDVSDGLAVGDDDWLGEVVVWVGFFVGEEVGVAFAALVGVALGQPVAEADGLALAFGELVAVALVVGVALTVAVAVRVGLTLGVIVGLSVGLAGGVVVLGLAGGLLVVGVGDGLTFGVALGEVFLGVGDGEHDVTGEEVESPAEVAVPLRLPPTDPPAGDCPEGCWLDEEVAPLKADTTILPSPSRNGGTAASTTPTANTVTPMARAGRSMTSLQLLGRRGACRHWAAEPGRAGAAVRPDHACRKDPASCAKNPAIASRIAAILGWLA